MDIPRFKTAIPFCYKCKLHIICFVLCRDALISSVSVVFYVDMLNKYLMEFYCCFFILEIVLIHHYIAQ